MFTIFLLYTLLLIIFNGPQSGTGHLLFGPNPDPEVSRRLMEFAYKAFVGNTTSSIPTPLAAPAGRSVPLDKPPWVAKVTKALFITNAILFVFGLSLLYGYQTALLIRRGLRWMLAHLVVRPSCSLRNIVVPRQRTMDEEALATRSIRLHDTPKKSTTLLKFVQYIETLPSLSPTCSLKHNLHHSCPRLQSSSAASPYLNFHEAISQSSQVMELQDDEAAFHLQKKQATSSEELSLPMNTNAEHSVKKENVAPGAHISAANLPTSTMQETREFSFESIPLSPLFGSPKKSGSTPLASQALALDGYPLKSIENRQNLKPCQQKTEPKVNNEFVKFTREACIADSENLMKSNERKDDGNIVTSMALPVDIEEEVHNRPISDDAEDDNLDTHDHIQIDNHISETLATPSKPSNSSTFCLTSENNLTEDVVFAQPTEAVGPQNIGKSPIIPDRRLPALDSLEFLTGNAVKTVKLSPTPSQVVIVKKRSSPLAKYKNVMAWWKDRETGRMKQNVDYPASTSRLSSALFDRDTGSPNAVRTKTYFNTMPTRRVTAAYRFITSRAVSHNISDLDEPSDLCVKSQDNLPLEEFLPAIDSGTECLNTTDTIRSRTDTKPDLEVTGVHLPFKTRSIVRQRVTSLESNNSDVDEPKSLKSRSLQLLDSIRPVKSRISSRHEERDLVFDEEVDDGPMADHQIRKTELEDSVDLSGAKSITDERDSIAQATKSDCTSGLDGDHQLRNGTEPKDETEYRSESETQMNIKSSGNTEQESTSIASNQALSSSEFEQMIMGTKADYGSNDEDGDEGLNELSDIEQFVSSTFQSFDELPHYENVFLSSTSLLRPTEKAQTFSEDPSTLDLTTGRYIHSQKSRVSSLSCLQDNLTQTHSRSIHSLLSIPKGSSKALSHKNDRIEVKSIHPADVALLSKYTLGKLSSIELAQTSPRLVMNLDGGIAQHQSCHDASFKKAGSQYMLDHGAEDEKENIPPLFNDIQNGGFVPLTRQHARSSVPQAHDVTAAQDGLTGILADDDVEMAIDALEIDKENISKNGFARFASALKSPSNTLSRGKARAFSHISGHSRKVSPVIGLFKSSQPHEHVEVPAHIPQSSSFRVLPTISPPLHDEQDDVAKHQKKKSILGVHLGRKKKPILEVPKYNPVIKPRSSFFDLWSLGKQKTNTSFVIHQEQNIPRGGTRVFSNTSGNGSLKQTRKFSLRGHRGSKVL